MTSSSDAARNRTAWDRRSDDYQQRHGAFIGRDEPGWGMWRIPETELQVLGDVAGRDVLELGCGAAQWSILLPAGAESTYRSREETEWGRSWPLEEIWKVRKAG